MGIQDSKSGPVLIRGVPLRGPVLHYVQCFSLLCVYTHCTCVYAGPEVCGLWPVNTLQGMSCCAKLPVPPITLLQTHPLILLTDCESVQKTNTSCMTCTRGMWRVSILSCITTYRLKWYIVAAVYLEAAVSHVHVQTTVVVAAVYGRSGRQSLCH